MVDSAKTLSLQATNTNSVVHPHDTRTRRKQVQSEVATACSVAVSNIALNDALASVAPQPPSPSPADPSQPRRVTLIFENLDFDNTDLDRFSALIRQQLRHLGVVNASEVHIKLERGSVIAHIWLDNDIRKCPHPVQPPSNRERAHRSGQRRARHPLLAC